MTLIDRSEKEKNNKKIGELLKRARKKKNKTQADMVKVTGLSKNHISSVERGLWQASINMLIGYCEELDMSPNEILLYDNNPYIIESLQGYLYQLSTEEQASLCNYLDVYLKEKKRQQQ